MPFYNCSLVKLTQIILHGVIRIMSQLNDAQQILSLAEIEDAPSQPRAQEALFDGEEVLHIRATIQSDAQRDEENVRLCFLQRNGIHACQRTKVAPHE